MEIEYLLKLVSKAANGKNNFKDGAVQSNGFGFVFKKFDYNLRDSFIIGDGSSKLCSVGAFKGIYKKFIGIQGSLKSAKDLLNYNPKDDLYFGGALKTLVHGMEFGGYERLYRVWMFVKTPKGQLFPATFYHGKSGASVGAWSPDYRVFLFAEERTLPQEFESIINFNPFNFSDIELEEFTEALKFALDKVPISDFEGVYENDFGRELMGLKSGKPFAIFLENKRKENETWSYSIMGNDEAWNLNGDFIEIKNNHFTPEEDKKYPRNVPENMHKVLIERSYDHLVAHAYKKKSRLAFMVLGSFLMLYKSKMTEELKQVILEYSDWEHEKDQLKNEKDRKERKKFLDDFREKIKNYDGSKVIKLPLYTVTRVIDEKREKGDKTPIWRKNIDYSIKSINFDH